MVNCRVEVVFVFILIAHAIICKTIGVRPGALHGQNIQSPTSTQAGATSLAHTSSLPPGNLQHPIDLDSGGAQSSQQHHTLHIRKGSRTNPIEISDLGERTRPIEIDDSTRNPSSKVQSVQKPSNNRQLMTTEEKILKQSLYAKNRKLKAKANRFKSTNVRNSPSSDFEQSNRKPKGKKSGTQLIDQWLSHKP